MSVDTKRKDWIGYCAGLYEGEGTVGCYSNTLKAGTKNGLSRYGKQRYRKKDLDQTKISLRIGMTDLTPLELFRDTMDSGSIRGPYSYRDKKLIYVYSVRKFEDVQYIIAVLWPYLSERRRQQYTDGVKKFFNKVRTV
ncbi:MAG: hypothetical protein ACREOB_05150 [Thermodesulfobacteriota bacterium]